MGADAAGIGKKRRTGAVKAAAVAAVAAEPTGACDTSETTDDDGDGWTVAGKKRKVDTAGLAPALGAVGLKSADLLESHEVCRRFHNRIAIVGALPDSWDLGRPIGLQVAAAPKEKVLNASVMATDAVDAITKLIGDE